MKKCKRWLAVVLSVILIATTLIPMTVSAGQSTLRNRVVGYFPSYRYSAVNSIDFSAMSHCILSFMTYNNGTLSCGFNDSQIRTIKEKCDANDVKLMIALGGWGGFNYSNCPIDTPDERKKLVNDLMYYVDTYDLDGIDIDTEITDGLYWSNFDAFMSDLSAELKPDGKLLTMAVSGWFTDPIASSTYNYFDFINLMSYDYSNSDVAPMSQIYDLLSYYSARGVSNDRMTIGVPFYGYDANHGAYTYSEIIAGNKAASQLDNYNGISYNGMPTITKKAELSLDYGGIMIWEIGQDSFDPEYSLLNTIKKVYDASGSSTGIAPVTNLTATNTTYTGTKLSWTASEGAVSYKVYNGSTLLGSTTATSYNVTGLTNGTDYTFKVTAVNAEGKESYATSLNVKTPVDASAIAEWDANKAYLKGDQVSCDGKVYEAQWWTQNDRPSTSTSGVWKYIGEAGGIMPPYIDATGIKLYMKNAGDLTDVEVANNGSITVSNTNGAIYFAASLVPEEATSRGYTMSVSNNQVASVDGTYVTVTPSNATGDTRVVITATSDDGRFTVSYTVNINYTNASSSDSEIFVFKVDDKNVLYYNGGSKIAIDASATSINGKTYVPFRAAGAAAGITDLKFDSATSKITFTGFDGYKVEMQIGSTICTATKGSEILRLTIPAPEMKNGVTMLPVRETASLTGGSVIYNESGYVIVSNNTIDQDKIADYIAAF